MYSASSAVIGFNNSELGPKELQFTRKEPE